MGGCRGGGGGGGEGGRKSEWLDRALRPGKTEKAVDHRQNNSCVNGGGDLAIARQLVYFAIAVSTAVRSSHKDNVSSTAVAELLKQKKSNFLNPSPPPCS